MIIVGEAERTVNRIEPSFTIKVIERLEWKENT